MEMLDGGDYENSKEHLEKVIFEIVLQLKCKENTYRMPSIQTLVLFKNLFMLLQVVQIDLMGNVGCDFIYVLTLLLLTVTEIRTFDSLLN